MFDWVPARAWLLLILAIAAVMPAHYVFRHIPHEPGHRDITLPPEDLSWRSTRTLTFSLVALALLGAASIFIFTPAAEQMVRSPEFFPLLVIGLGGWMLYTVWQGYRTGKIEPMSRGSLGIFDRQTQPKRFWASMIWNGVLGVGCMALAVAMHNQTETERLNSACYSRGDTNAPAEQIAACTALIDYGDASDAGQLAAYYSLRGRVYHDQKDWNRAFADYSQAIKLDPDDAAYARYNRAFVYLYRYQLRPAADDLTAIIQNNPDGIESLGAYAQRAWIYEHLGDDARATDDRAKLKALQARHQTIMRKEDGTKGAR